MHRTVQTVAIVFLLLGLGLLASTAFLATRASSFVKRAEWVDGEVIRLEAVRSQKSTTYRPVVRFTTAAGESLTVASTSSSSPPSFRVGESVGVLYEPDRPHEAQLDTWFSLWGPTTILGGLGFLFAPIGGGMLLAHRRRVAVIAELRRAGHSVETTFQNVEHNTSLRVNGRSPWRIVTQWKNPATGELHLFESEDLWFDPTAHVGAKPITVFVDPQAPERYAMDLSFLPTLRQ